MSISKKIDHTLLKATATVQDIENLCKEAIEYNFATVCVNPIYVPIAATKLKNSGIGICTVVGFPLGASRTAVKVTEALDSINAGATEIDMVISIGMLKSGKIDQVRYEIEQMVLACHSKSVILKVILETCYLNEEEITTAIQICKACEVDFIKTSTGFGTHGATVEDIHLMHSLAGNELKIKASGGIKSFEDAETMINAGAERIGTSNSVAIIKNTISESYSY